MNVEIGTEAPIFLFWEISKFQYFIFAVWDIIVEDDKYRHGLKGGGTLLNLCMHETVNNGLVFERMWEIIDSVNAEDHKP
jgi:hypothetical protein